MNIVLTELSAWTALQNNADVLHTTNNKPQLNNSVVRLAGLTLNYSFSCLTQNTLYSLVQLAEQQRLGPAIQNLTQGCTVNFTEQRPALHTAARLPKAAVLELDGHNITAEIHQQLDKMQQFSNAVRNKHYTGSTGLAITDIVNIGIGGSDLGPQCVCHALHDYASKALTVHFLSGNDPKHFEHLSQRLNPETTLFLMASKSFSTLETLHNAERAKAFCAALDWQQHFFALTANTQAALAFGIKQHNIFKCWDWIGGRFSLWSVMGLSIALQCGFDVFEQLLQGAHAMDRHFIETPFEYNMPVILALLNIWNINFLGANTTAILPYNYCFKALIAHLQQLDMESLGKRITRDGNIVDYATGAIIWGCLEPDAQHSFHQLLLQGTHCVPCEFIGVKGSEFNVEQHAQHLLFGNNAHDDKHQQLPGLNPSVHIELDELTPFNLGQLLALYEHKVYVQSVIWQINAFDQFGVRVAKEIHYDND